MPGRQEKTDDYDAALVPITEALRLQPASSEALILESEIDALPEILNLLEAVRVARVENNDASELDFLRQLLPLDPSRAGVRERMETTG